MTLFRGARQYQDGPSAWTRSEAFAHASWFKGCWRDELKPLLRPLGLEDQPCLKDDKRGLLLTTESTMHTRRDYVLGWVRDMLGLKHTDGWRAGPPSFLSQLVEDFYKQAGQAVAWVMVESCRDSIRLRHGGFKETLLPSTRPDFLLRANRIEDRVKLRLLPGIELSTEGLQMVPPKGLELRDTHFTRMAVQRTLAIDSSPMPLIGQWMTWCLASPDADREALSRGFAPAGGQCLLAGGINPARLMTWVKLIHGWTYSYAVDVHPESGNIFSIRYAGVSLRMQIELDPWLDDWLLTAIRSF